MSNEITVKYNIGVKTAAGWRQEEVTALAELNATGKKCIIKKVMDIGGNGNSGYASRTGAKRQEYSVGYFAKAEEGKTKIVSSLKIVGEVAA